jgi:hypothetical protein
VYDPNVVPQLTQAMKKSGILGGEGFFYPPNDPVQP